MWGSDLKSKTRSSLLVFIWIWKLKSDLTGVRSVFSISENRELLNMFILQAVGSVDKALTYSTKQLQGNDWNISQTSCWDLCSIVVSNISAFKMYWCNIKIIIILMINEKIFFSSSSAVHPLLLYRGWSVLN